MKREAGGKSFLFHVLCYMFHNQFNQRNHILIKSAESIYSYQNLLACYYACRKNKRKTINAAEFEIKFETKLFKLQKELQNHTYQPGQSICFVVKKPKLREIFAADFRDRIVHHILVGYLQQIWEKKFIDQSYACREGKGTHQALRDLQRYLAKASLGRRRKVYYLQLDIQSFFVSLNKNILFEIIKKEVKNPEILWLAKTIIFHNPTENYYKKGQLDLFDLIPAHKSLFNNPPNRGLPIGNLTSQFFANVYLNELDQYVKHILKVKYYQRYVDDFILLSEDREQLKEWRDKIGQFLQEKLALKLHPKKQILQNVKKGINFVGFIIKSEYVLIRRRTVKALKARLWRFNQEINKSIRNNESLTKERLDKIVGVINSYFGQFKHGQTFGLRRVLWQKDFGVLRNILIPADEGYSHLKILRQKL